MVRQRYIGITNPETDFEQLRDFYVKLRNMQRKCKPLEADYLALQAVLHALADAAHHFTKDPHFYGGAAPRS